MKKKITQQLLWLFGFLGFLALKLFSFTYRIKYTYSDSYLKKDPIDPVILVFWHENLIMATCALAHKNYSPIVSRSESGRVVAFVLKLFGFNPFLGSGDRNNASKGGRSALLGLIRKLRNKDSVIITVDGSIGPRHKVKHGCLFLSSKSKVPLVPVGFLCSSYFEFNTWDRLKLPKPFAKIEVFFSDPIDCLADDFEKEAFYLEEKIHQASYTNYVK